MSATIADVLEGRARFAVVCADNAEILPGLPEKAFDHTICDPPYEAQAHTLQRRAVRNNGKHDGGAYNNNGGVCRIESLSFAPMTEAGRASTAGQIARITKRWSAVFCQVEAAMKWAEVLAASGAPCRRIGVWVKPDAMPQYSGDRPGMGYESLVFAHRKGGRVGVFVHNKNEADREHETQKPLPLMVELIQLFTDPGDLILDPWCGSGSTMVAALRLGRRAVGIEINPKYAALAQERCLAELDGNSLSAARAGQASLFGATHD